MAKRHGCGRGSQVKAASCRKAVSPKNHGEALRLAVTWVVRENCFRSLRFHGNTQWVVSDFVLLAVLWVWSDHATLTGGFAEAYGWSMKVLGRAAVKSYQGLTGALSSATEKLLPLLGVRMQELMERHGGEYWRISGWLPLAVDGSRQRTPDGT